MEHRTARKTKFVNHRGFIPHLLWGKKREIHLLSRKRGTRLAKQVGFTLIELLVVISIIGIL